MCVDRELDTLTQLPPAEQLDKSASKTATQENRSCSRDLHGHVPFKTTDSATVAVDAPSSAGGIQLIVDWTPSPRDGRVPLEMSLYQPLSSAQRRYEPEDA